MACYQVKLPPLFDDTMINNLISTLKWAPVLMIFNGYWMLSNLQIFDNKWSYIPNSNANTHMQSEHFITLQINWAFPMLVMAFSSVAMSIFIACCPHELRMKLGFSHQKKEIKVNQDLPPFLETMLLSQADHMVLDD
jgi:hypothetical protein